MSGPPGTAPRGATGGAPGPPPPGGAGAERGDRPLLFSLLALLALAASLTPIRNYDYWWHLAAGRLILEERAVPRADPFSFTAAGTPWIDHEWLFQVLLVLGQGSLGPAGLVLLKAGVVLGLTLLLASHLRRCGHGPAGTAIVLVPVLAGAAFRLDVRPELATLVAAPLTLHCLTRARETGRRGPLIAVPAIAALWANLHVGVVTAPVLVAAALAGTLLLDRAPRMNGDPGPRFARRLLILAPLTAAAVGANPYGFRLYAVPFELSRLLASLPAPNLEWAPPALDEFPIFWAAIACAAAIAILGRRGLDPIGAPALLVAGALAVLHLRNVGLFFVLLPYGIGRPLRLLADRLPGRGIGRALPGHGRVRPGFVLAAVLVVSAIPLLPFVPPGLRFGIGVSSDNEPRAAVDLLEREGVGERLFNDVRFGGYLVWRRHPERRVFIDGRNEVYAGLLRDIFAALKDADSWRRLLERHRIDAAMLRYPPALQKVLYAAEDGGPPIEGERAFAAAYFPREAWALVYWDDDAMILLRRSPEQASLIARLEYLHIHPDDWRRQFAGAATGRLALQPILDEIRRKLREEPGCRRARALLAAFSGLQRPRGPGAPPEKGGR